MVPALITAAIPVEVQVVLISTAGTVVAGLGVAIIGLFVKRLSGRIGDPNGAGDIVQMLTTILRGQAGQDTRIAKLEGGQHEIRQDVARLTGRVDTIERRTP